MTLIRKGIEQIRREGLANAQAKIKQQEDYQAKVDSMSKHSVGGLYDVRQIMKSKQFKEQKNHYNLQMAETELEDLLQYHLNYIQQYFLYFLQYRYLKQVNFLL